MPPFVWIEIGLAPQHLLALAGLIELLSDHPFEVLRQTDQPNSIDEQRRRCINADRSTIFLILVNARPSRLARYACVECCYIEVQALGRRVDVVVDVSDRDRSLAAVIVAREVPEGFGVLQSRAFGADRGTNRPQMTVERIVLVDDANFVLIGRMHHRLESLE